LTNMLLPYALTQMTDDGMPASARPRLNPDLVAPVLTALASPECRLNGEYLVTGGGRLRRASVVEWGTVLLPNGPGLSPGQVLDRGLWRYTRHPNYFGDAVVWFGLWLLACSHWLGLILVACPLYMTNMLVRHTGKRLLEKHMARSKGAAYAEYVRRTSGFIPR